MKNNILKNILSLFVLLFSVTAVYAQTTKDIIINEVLVKNTDSYENEYGEKVGWIELKNTGYSSVNIAGCHIKVTDNSGNIISYAIPKNDARTIIKPLDYVIFFADGIDSRGTFYTNFTLENTKQVSLYDASGKGEPISSISYDSNSLGDNMSIGYITTADDEPLSLKRLSSATPGASNEELVIQKRSEIFDIQDPSGIAMAITAMCIVFFALFFLFSVFKQLGILLVLISKKKDAIKNNKTLKTNVSTVEMMKNELNVEILAAIAIAIKQYEEDLHDVESEIVTINRTARAYSPWNSKIYGVGNTPRK